MRRKIAIVAALAATLVGAAACGNDPTPAADPLNGEGKTIKVWLMVDAESGWKNVVEDANARFTAATKAQVKVEYQQWANRYTRLDAAMAGSRRAGRGRARQHRHAEVRLRRRLRARSTSRGSRTRATWLTGLSDPCTLDGKTYCVPYYAGARVLIYRTDLLEKAGLKPPTTYTELLAAADKLKANNARPELRRLLHAGCLLVRRHVVGLRRGWPDRDQGLGRQVDRHPVGVEGARPVCRSGPTWRRTTPRVTRPRTRTTRTRSSPRVTPRSSTATAGSSARCSRSARTPTTRTRRWSTPRSRARSPRFRCRAPPPARACRRSSVARPSRSPARARTQALAQEWIKYFTDTKAQEGLIAKGALPNATALLDKAAAVKGNEATALAAKNSWFVPMAPKWADVESNNVLQQMLRDIATGKKSVSEATKWADGEITRHPQRDLIGVAT